jgi:hypothetical protein
MSRYGGLSDKIAKRYLISRGYRTAERLDDPL